MVIKLSRHAIRQWCSPQTYQKGERLSNGGKVNVLRYDEDEGIYIAEVLGHERNQVQVYEDAQGAPVARCTCPSLSTGGMYCHHVVAVLIRISDLKHSAQAGSVRTDAARQMTGSAMSASDEDGGEIAERIIRLFEEVGYYLGIGIANVINTFNPELVVIGNRLSLIKPWIEASMLACVEQRSLQYHHKRVHIVFSKLAMKSAAVGAAELAIKAFFAQTKATVEEG